MTGEHGSRHGLGRRVLVAGAVLAAACTADPAPRAAPTPAGTTATTAPTAPPARPDIAPEPTVRVSVERAGAHVSSPTKNIGCYVGQESVLCAIGEYDWRLPPRPADCPPSEADWSAAVGIRTGGRVVVGTCATDTVLGAERVLAYGTAVQVGAFRCTSLRAGMTCVHRPTGRGFLLSRARYRTF